MTKKIYYIVQNPMEFLSLHGFFLLPVMAIQVIFLYFFDTSNDEEAFS